MAQWSDKPCVLRKATKGQRYARVWVAGKLVRAHRAAYVQEYGPIPAGVYVLHHCDNPECVEPTHLFLGTQSDNMRDMREKDRYPHRTHCPQGHAYAEHGRKVTRGDRWFWVCKTCQNAASRAWRTKHKEQSS